MIRQSTIELLKEMRFGGMASELEQQQKDMEAYRDMPFDDRLAMLVDAEWNRRQANKYNRCVHNARFAIPGATVEGIEYFEDRKLSKKTDDPVFDLQIHRRGTSHHLPRSQRKR